MLDNRFQVIFEGTKNYYPEFKHTKSVKSMTLSKEITGLYPGTKYTFVVVATTHCGKGDNSTMVTEYTIRDGKLYINAELFQSTVL